MRCFPQKSYFITEYLFDLVSPMMIHLPSNWGLTLSILDLASAWHLEERSQVLETSGGDFTNGFMSRFRLKFKTLVLNFVKRMLSLWY